MENVPPILFSDRKYFDQKMTFTCLNLEGNSTTILRKIWKKYFSGQYAFQRENLWTFPMEAWQFLLAGEEAHRI